MPDNASDKPFDFLILGDSHAIALTNGAEKLGYRVGTLQFSGAGWHDRRFVIGSNGIEVKGVPAASKSLAALREALGIEDVFGSGLPVLSTVGFHLGRLVPPLSWNKHRAYVPGESYAPEEKVISSAFLQDYVMDARARHFRLARRLQRMDVPLTIIAPPRTEDRRNFEPVRQLIIDQYREIGVNVYDPQEDIVDPKTGLLPKALMEDDGQHGTTDYGAQVIENLIKREALAA